MRPADATTEATAELVARLARELAARGWMVTVAESCTGGLIAAALTDRAGASAYFARGYITYANDAKTELLGVPAALISRHGAVSAAVAEAMAEGARRMARADAALSVTGIAGPDGGTTAKPVGLVYIAAATAGGVEVGKFHFAGDRAAIRAQARDGALRLLLDVLASSAAQ